MKDSELYKKLSNAVTFAISKSGQIHYQKRIERVNRNELDVIAEYHHYFFQERRGQDLAFHEYLLGQSIRSPVFKSHTEALMRAIVGDLVQGHFELEIFQSSADIEKYFTSKSTKKPKGGRYEPRHVRRVINEENVSIFFEKGRDEVDGRIKKLTSTFNLSAPLPSGISDLAKHLMENEKIEFYQNIDIYSGIGFSQYLLPRYWEICEIEKKLFGKALYSASGDEEIKKELGRWVQTDDSILNTLINHVVSLETIADFMRRPAASRDEILKSHRDLTLTVDQLITGLNIASLQEERHPALRGCPKVDRKKRLPRPFDSWHELPEGECFQRK